MIKVNTFKGGEFDAITIYIEGAESANRFRELIQRGAQTWADASAEIKTAADLITNGEEMQPYGQMSGEKK